MDFTVHHEHDSHFDVSGKDGKPFKVVKQGLSPQLLTKIREHQVAQLFSGGKVRGYAEGGGVEDMDTAPPPVPQLASLGPTPSGPTYGFESGSGPNPADELSNDGGTPPPAMQAALDAERPAFRDAPPGGQPKAKSDTAGATPTPKAPDAPAPKEKPLPNPMGGLERDLVAAGRTKAEGEDEQAKVLGQKGAEVQRMQETYAQQLKAASDARQQQFSKYQQRADEVAEGIAHGGINPNQYWANQSTGQKVGSALAMILGGIGAGVSGQPNAALQIIDKAIDRDIEAQKIHLDNQKWLVGHYVQQGHSVNEAAQLAKADLRDYTAAMLDASAGKFAGPEAQAMAKQHRGDTQRQTATDRMSMRNAGLEAQQKAMQIQMERQQLALLPYQRAVSMALRTGKAMPQDARALMDKEDEARAVNLGNNLVGLANTPKDRDELVETQQHYQSLHSALKRFESLAGTTGLGGTDTTLGAQALGDVQRELAAMYGYSRAPGGDLEKQFDAGLSNPTTLWKSKGAILKQAKLAKDIANRHMIAANATRLVGGLDAASAAYGGQ